MIPFVRDMSFEYGRADQVSPLIRRVVAENPGPFTYTGTGAHIVGRGEVAVIDPGPDDPAQVAAILAATRGETITRIFVTHSHLDHSPAARPLAEATGAVIYAGGAPCRPSRGAERLEAGDDVAFRPDEALADGQVFRGPGWSIEAVATPGHTSNHYAYALLEENVLFPGDCVMGWSTSVVSPPDGDMGLYMRSLERIRARRYARLLPAHGPPVEATGPFLDAYIAHRRQRETQVLLALETHGAATVRQLVERLYADHDRRLHPAACHSVLAHLLDLFRRGLVDAAGPPDMAALWRPSFMRHAA
ncbi:MAG: MBL fold metallo-hydrolase [Phenylobacterium sp.]|uniref:MBL fold metallo-hydrolase n=1 Tax=Phenylobacterium sp. TaxID=1871053 RepID=UPI001A4549ED|nr:MBL fold metallo-hydrolase [Phenylobacterium sp.]MBL8770235.1 MBL fold metallo-hydrolase [Phenylobacterium sp.]